MGLLDLFFPKYCMYCKQLGEYLCSSCFALLSFETTDICLVCQKPAIAGFTHPSCTTKYSIDGAVASLVYSPVMEKLIYRFKYKPYIQDLERILLDLFYEGIIQKPLIVAGITPHTLMVPIPLHTRKQRQRGYNQAEILAKGMAARFQIPFINVLHRVKATKSQYRLGREERRENIAGAFSLDQQQKAFIQNAQIMLVDDVLTSGATMMEAAKVLKRNGAKKVYGIALARGR